MRGGGGAMVGVGPAQRDAGQEGDDGAVAPVELHQRLAVAWP